jgi:multiple sugar transport system permease protein
MFPTPIERTALLADHYQTLLPLALILWLLPLIAVAIFSVKPDADFANANYWGVALVFRAVHQLRSVFTGSDMPRYLLNSFKITVPTVIGAVALSCMTGFALGIYRFKGNLLIFFMFIAGNFVPFQILMVPVRDLTFSLGLYDTITGLVLFHIAFQTGFCTLFMRNFIRALPYELIEAARVEGVAEWRIFWFVVLPLMKPAIAALSADLHLHLERLLLGDRADPGPERAAGDGGDHVVQQPVRAQYHLMSAGSIVAAICPRC